MAAAAAEAAGAAASRRTLAAPGIGGGGGGGGGATAGGVAARLRVRTISMPPHLPEVATMVALLSISRALRAPPSSTRMQ